MFLLCSHSMSRRLTPQKTEEDTAFPIRIKVHAP
jgi:hypothetical protein